MRRFALCLALLLAPAPALAEPSAASLYDDCVMSAVPPEKQSREGFVAVKRCGNFVRGVVQRLGWPDYDMEKAKKIAEAKGRENMFNDILAKHGVPPVQIDVSELSDSDLRFARCPRARSSDGDFAIHDYALADIVARYIDAHLTGWLDRHLTSGSTVVEKAMREAFPGCARQATTQLR